MIYFLSSIVVFAILINLRKLPQGYSFFKIFNVFWWFANDMAPVERQAAFFPGERLFTRRLLWALRFPLANFFNFVIGLGDKKQWINFGNVWGRDGKGLNLILPFISYKGKFFSFYIGWKKGYNFGVYIGR